MFFELVFIVFCCILHHAVWYLLYHFLMKKREKSFKSVFVFFCRRFESRHFQNSSEEPRHERQHPKPAKVSGNEIENVKKDWPNLLATMIMTAKLEKCFFFLHGSVRWTA
jgi:hypothetical protein